MDFIIIIVVITIKSLYTYIYIQFWDSDYSIRLFQ